MIDTGNVGAAKHTHAAVRAWSGDPLHTVVYSHGHIDHVLALKPFLEAGERPQSSRRRTAPPASAVIG